MPSGGGHDSSTNANPPASSSNPSSPRREAILNAPLVKTLLSLAWPLFITAQVASATSLITVFWISRMLSKEGLAVHAMLGPIRFLVIWGVCNSICGGARALIARAAGKGDHSGAEILRSVVQLTLLAALVVAAAAFLAAGPAAQALAGELGLADELLRYYLPWFGLAFPAFMMSLVLLAAVAASGWTSFGLRRALFELALMAALMPLLIRVFGLGISSAPLAVAGASLFLVVVTWRALRRHPELGLGDLPSWTGWWSWIRGADRSWWRRVLAIGVPAQMSRLALFATELVYVRLITEDGVAPVAAYGLCNEIFIVLSSLALALSSATGIVVAQNLGAGRTARCVAAVQRSGLIGAGLVLACWVFTALCSRWVFSLLTDDAAVIDAATSAFAILQWGLAGSTAMQILFSAYIATGRTAGAGALAVVGEVIGLGVALAVDADALTAVSYGVLAANTSKALLLLLLLRTSLLEPLARASQTSGGAPDPR